MTSISEELAFSELTSTLTTGAGSFFETCFTSPKTMTFTLCIVCVYGQYCWPVYATFHNDGDIFPWRWRKMIFSGRWRHYLFLTMEASIIEDGDIIFYWRWIHLFLTMGTDYLFLTMGTDYLFLTMETSFHDDGERLSFPDDGDIIFSWRWSHYLFLTMEASIIDDGDRLSFTDDGYIFSWRWGQIIFSWRWRQIIFSWRWRHLFLTMETDYIFQMMETLSFPDDVDRLSFPDDGDIIFFWRWRQIVSECYEPYSTDEYAWTDKSFMLFPSYFM